MSILKQYQDIDIYGNEDSSGRPLEYYDSDAVKNAFTLWASSKPNDFLMNPNAGGILDKMLFKNMDSYSIGMTVFSMKNALFKEFSPVIDILDFQINNDYSNKISSINIFFKERSTQKINSTEIYVKKIKTVIEQAEQIVAYTGENLKMFVIIRKVDMEGERLAYDSNELVWRWGKYKFSNFSESDPYYAEILSLANA